MNPKAPIKLEADSFGIVNFLKSKYFPGVGEVFAQRIYDTLRERLSKMETLEESDFMEVPGLGEKAAGTIVSSVKALPLSSSLLSFLFSCGISYQEINKIISRYGPYTERVVTENPYEMVEDVWKFSFFRADKIGSRLGIEKDDQRRLAGALLTSVKIHAEQGSLFSTREELMTTASGISHVDKENFPTVLDNLIGEERLIESLGGIYLPVYYKAEKETARKIASIISDKSNCQEVKFDPPSQDIEGHYFTGEQINAILSVRDNPICIITGDPGTGKTTTIRGLIKLFEDEGKKVILTAPTGRSTKKMETLAGSSAKTIHRLLGFNRGKGYFNKKIEADVLIIDEASLLEQVLFNHLLQALPDKIKIILVGDPGQLPPIGAGRVLEDLIESGMVKVARLTHNFRQEQGSDLALSIEKIKKGEIPSPSANGDFDFINESDDIKTKETLLDQVTKVLPDKLGVSPTDIQVVTPQLDGLLGTRELNKSLQQLLQPHSLQISKGLKCFRLGDRVVQSENSGRRGVYNGETGKITSLDPIEGTLTVTFADGKTSSYSSDQLKELSLAYATSVHKIQGTETDYLVMPLTMEHKKNLHRNLLFTAVSRARKYCGLIGDMEALKTAVENPAPQIRNSNLKLRLQRLLTPHSPNFANSED